MLYYNLTPIFKARGITKPYSFLVKAGLSPQTAHAILNSHSRSLRLDHLEILCKSLVCEPNDLLAYQPNQNEHLYPDHPLHNLKPNDNLKDMRQTLANIPFKQLKEITKQLNNNTD